MGEEMGAKEVRKGKNWKKGKKQGMLKCSEK